MRAYSEKSNQKGLELNILAFFRELTKKLWIVLIVAIVAGIITAAVSEATKVETYTSTISFVVNTNMDGERANSGDISAQINMSGTFRYILSSSVMKEAIVQNCSTPVDYGTVSGSISVSTVPSTNVIIMSVTTGDPKISYAIASTAVDVYGDVIAKTYPNAKLTLCDKPVLPGGSNANRSSFVMVVVVSFAAAILCCLVFFIMFLVKDTVKTSDELNDKLDIHILGSVQQVENKNKTMKGLLVTDRKTGFSFIETYKAIRTKIENNSARTGNKVFLVTSACENEGKTTSAVNIALSLAQNGKNVLLIDADLRKPSVCKMLSLPETDGGLSDVILGNMTLGNAIKRVSTFDICVLADRKSVANPSELLSTDRMEEIIKSVRSEFDYVIIDTAPASVVTDTSVIAGFVDAAIIVVREDFSPYSRIKMSIDDIDSNGAEIIGCIFNVDTSHSGETGRYGKYGKYGKRGYGSYGYGYGRHSSQKNN